MTRPANEVALEPSPASSPHANGSPSRPRGVLVIDDNEDVRVFLGKGLRASGFAVWLAADGHEGVAVYQEHASVIDLLLLDILMPGWSGPETLTAIRAFAPDLRCCFMSGDTGHYTEEELLGLGAVAVLRKPFPLGELIKQLRRLAKPIEQPDEPQEDRWCDDGGG